MKSSNLSSWIAYRLIDHPLQVIKPLNFIFRQCPAVDAKVVHASRGAIPIGGMSHEEHLLDAETPRVVLMRVGEAVHRIAPHSHRGSLPRNRVMVPQAIVRVVV